MINTRARIIINADDFGLSSAVNEAVFAGARDGVLTSATIMSNMPGFEEAIIGAKEIEQLGVGVHLNLLRGKPLSDPKSIHTLVDKRGEFIGNVLKLWTGFALGVIKPEHVELELSAQIQRVIDSGILPTHFDSERHLHHLIPKFGLIACRLAKKFKVKHIRVVREPLLPLAQPIRARFPQFMKAVIVNRWGMKLAQTAKEHGLTFVDRFYGLALTGHVTANAYQWLVGNVDGSTVEIMCHPATRGGDDQPSWLDHQRINEYRALLDPATIQAIDGSGAELINYGQL